MNGANVKVYSKAKDGAKALSESFRVSEFACRDGSDTVFVSPDLVSILQKIRDRFGKSVVINSGYRTEAYNKKIGGAAYSQHKYGTAADIAVSGVTPLEVAQYAETLLPDRGGIGLYSGFTHVDVRTGRSRWDSTSGKETAVSGFPGGTADHGGETAEADSTPAAAHKEGVEWAVEQGILTGNAQGSLLLAQPVTRQQLCTMLYRLAKKLGAAK